MSKFSTQFESALSNSGISRNDMASKSGLHYMTITNYANGRRQPDVDAMRAICKALPPEEAAALLVARLADECPSEFEALIRLEPRDPTLSSTPIIAYLPELPPKLREALDVIARAAALTKEWHELVLDLATVARPVIAQKYPQPQPADLAAAEGAASYGELIGHITTDKARRVLTIDAAFTAICGYTLPEVLGRNLKEVLRLHQSTPADTIARLQAAIDAGQPTRATVINYHKNDTPYKATLHIHPTPEGFAGEVRLLPQSADLAAAEGEGDASYGKRELDKTITGALQASLTPPAPAPAPTQAKP